MTDLPDPAQEKRDLRDENERLREALKEIQRKAALGVEKDLSLPTQAFRQIRSVATDALNETTTDPNET